MLRFRIEELETLHPAAPLTLDLQLALQARLIAKRSQLPYPILYSIASSVCIFTITCILSVHYLFSLLIVLVLLLLSQVLRAPSSFHATQTTVEEPSPWACNF
ncbi:unnamed protein product [Gongylonema pulchrum]|uniref:Transmembrane protein n=1 Tax=Gongylonema pulchrum TaxID=637853 RepID=A0A183CVQ8_9BILA|nr:unnamed protein product [Gongylonema pulchrum]